MHSKAYHMWSVLCLCRHVVHSCDDHANRWHGFSFFPAVHDVGRKPTDAYTTERRKWRLQTFARRLEVSIYRGAQTFVHTDRHIRTNIHSDNGPSAQMSTSATSQLDAKRMAVATTVVRVVVGMGEQEAVNSRINIEWFVFVTSSAQHYNMSCICARHCERTFFFVLHAIRVHYFCRPYYLSLHGAHNFSPLYFHLSKCASNAMRTAFVRIETGKTTATTVVRSLAGEYAAHNAASSNRANIYSNDCHSGRMSLFRRIPPDKSGMWNIDIMPMVRADSVRLADSKLMLNENVRFYRRCRRWNVRSVVVVCIEQYTNSMVQSYNAFVMTTITIVVVYSVSGYGHRSGISHSRCDIH